MAGEPSSLTRLLDPSSVAFVGGERAAFAIEQSRLLGFEGEIWAVNPTRSELAGVSTVATVADLPGVPDAAFVAVDRVMSIEVVAALRHLGAGGAVCYASGYAESGSEGSALQARLLLAAADMPIIGPNCHGYINALSGAVLWPDVHGCRRVERGVAIITQSGNLAINVTMQQRGLGLSHVITLGNQAGVGIEDCLEALVDDERVTAIGLHIEALSDPIRFGQAAIRAHDLG
jgi:acyl-CoA synthetase (NDP forming)